MTECPTRVIMLSSYRESGWEVIRALERGAIDFICKPTGEHLPNIEAIEQEIVSKIRNAMNVSVEHLEPVSACPVGAVDIEPRSGGGYLVVIGASTGGPRALSQLLAGFPTTMPAAVIVVQHMPAGFTNSFAERLNQELSWNVVEGKDEDILKPGTIYVAPGGKHLELVSQIDRCYLKTLPEKSRDGYYTPSIDLAMESAAFTHGPKAIGVLLTGMGSDGVAGLSAIRENGGSTIVESEESAIVFGMPKAAIERGVADFVVPLGGIAAKLMTLFAAERNDVRFG